jgi:hypothetical protein
MDVRQANPDLHSRTRSEAESATSGVDSLWLLSLAIQEKVTRSPQASGSFVLDTCGARSKWMTSFAVEGPACAGMTNQGNWAFPAFVGMANIGMQKKVTRSPQADQEAIWRTTWRASGAGQPAA